MRSQLDRSSHERDQLCYPGSLVADDRRMGRLWNVEVRRCCQTPAPESCSEVKLTSLHDSSAFFYHAASGRLVCMAWGSRPITMASRRRIVYPWQ